MSANAPHSDTQGTSTDRAGTSYTSVFRMGFSTDEARLRLAVSVLPFLSRTTDQLALPVGSMSFSRRPLSLRLHAIDPSFQFIQKLNDGFRLPDRLTFPRRHNALPNISDVVLKVARRPFRFRQPIFHSRDHILYWIHRFPTPLRFRLP